MDCLKWDILFLLLQIALIRKQLKHLLCFRHRLGKRCFLSALFTGLNIYHKLAKHAGAGTLVPITGFANAIVSPAIEFKREGYVLGVAAKMFSIAGPVLAYGIGSSVIVGFIYWVLKMF